MAHGFKATLLHVQKSDILSQRVLVPPLPEQQKIAKILQTWDRAIATTEKLIDASKQQKKALMQQLLTGKKRFAGFDGEWEQDKLNDLGSTYTGLTGKTKDDFGTGTAYIPYINIFKNASIDINALERVQVDENEKQNTVQFGDIFFTTSSETAEEVGMSSVLLWRPLFPVHLNSFCFGFRLNDLNRAAPEFLKHLFRGHTFRRSISVLAQGATRYNLPKRQFLNVELNLPEMAEQRKIANLLDNAEDQIAIFEQKLAFLTNEKSALMQQLLTGKRRVKVDEAA